MLWAAGGCFAAATVLAAQTPGNSDTMRELLAEVRGLRLALERAATSGPRIQVLMARVQVQEQRMLNLTNRLTAVRGEIASIDQQLPSITMTMRQLEQQIKRVSEPNEREALEEQVAGLRMQNETSLARRQELASEDALLAQQLGDEQTRANELQDRLDQLERSLAAPSR
jgi:chromosome segregation ATPase